MIYYYAHFASAFVRATPRVDSLERAAHDALAFKRSFMEPA